MVTVKSGACYDMDRAVQTRVVDTNQANCVRERK